MNHLELEGGLARPTLKMVVSVFMLISAFFLVVSHVLAAPVEAPLAHAKLALISEYSKIKPGQDFSVGLKFELEPNWHIYWQNPGDTGKPTEVKWQPSQGLEVGGIEWPSPERFLTGPLASYGYSGEVVLPVTIHRTERLTPGSSVLLKAQVRWLICADVCIPQKAEVAITLPVGESLQFGPEAFRFLESRQKMPKVAPLSWLATATSKSDRFEFSLTIPEGELPETLQFFPEEAGWIDHAAEQKLLRHDRHLLLSIPKSSGSGEAPARLRGLWVIPGQYYHVEVLVEGGGSGDLWQAILFAFLGGLILNLMPCVFPVLFIKALSLVEQARQGKREIHLHGMAYLAGVLVCFWSLATLLLIVRAGGQSLGWGFQLQSPGFVSGLALLLFMMGLNLLGVFEIDGASGVGSKLAARSGYGGSFFTGVLATVVATPCTAPFMGTALAFALAQPAWIALAVFTALGLGLAIPYVLFSFSPVLSRVLPKPGRWMETFKQAMAFPIMATVIWLVYVLGQQLGVAQVILSLVGLLISAFAAWSLGRWRTKWSKLSAAVLLGLSLFTMNISGKPSSDGWENYSASRLEKLIEQGKPVFLDFTAAWCVTCQVNEAVVLGSRSVKQRFVERGVTLMRADWTNSDPEITRALSKFGRNGVPLYVWYSGKPGAEPKILPQLLTPSGVLSEIN